MMVIVYMLVYVFVTFGLFNLILGIFVESTMQSAKKRSMTRIKERQHMAKKLQRLTDELCKRCSDNGQGEQLLITRDMFGRFFDEPELVSLIEDLQVSFTDYASLFDTLDADDNGVLDVHEFINGVMRLQGSANNDVAALLGLRSLQKEFKRFEEVFVFMETSKSDVRSAVAIPNLEERG